MYILNFVGSCDFVHVVYKFPVYLAVTEGQCGADIVQVILFHVDLCRHNYGITVREAARGI